MVPEAGTCVGAFPPTVTVTVSIDCLPFPAVIINSPHWAGEPWYIVCCCIPQAGIGRDGVPPGTVTMICESVQLVTAAGIPPMVTLVAVLQVALAAVGA